MRAIRFGSAFKESTAMTLAPVAGGAATLAAPLIFTMDRR